MSISGRNGWWGVVRTNQSNPQTTCGKMIFILTSLGINLKEKNSLEVDFLRDNPSFEISKLVIKKPNFNFNKLDDTTSGVFWTTYLLGCPRKLGSMVRISGL